MDIKKNTLPVDAIVKMVVFILIMPFTTILISWKWDWWEAWAYGILSVVGFAVSRRLALQRNPDIMKERAGYGKQENTQSWDKVLSPLVALGGVFILITAGLDMLLAWPPSFSLPVKIIALVIILAGYSLGSWALIENRYFSGVVRLQTDRGHSVVSSGPYRLVRHPGYAGTVITYLAIPFLLDSAWALIPAVILVGLLFWRTALEDRFLQDNLEGYKDFTHKTRFRLIPGIW